MFFYVIKAVCLIFVPIRGEYLFMLRLSFLNGTAKTNDCKRIKEETF